MFSVLKAVEEDRGGWEFDRIGVRGVLEVGEKIAEGESSKRAGSGRNKGKLCNNAFILCNNIEKRLKGRSQEKRGRG